MWTKRNGVFSVGELSSWRFSYFSLPLSKTNKLLRCVPVKKNNKMKKTTAEKEEWQNIKKKG